MLFSISISTILLREQVDVIPLFHWDGSMDGSLDCHRKKRIQLVGNVALKPTEKNVAHKELMQVIFYL